MKLKSWPLIPNHITNDQDAFLMGEGIMSNAELEGRLSTIGGMIKNPVVIMEFPKYHNWAPFRTSSKSAYRDCHPACQAFREFEETKTNLCFGKDACKKIENIYAGLFRDLNKTNINEKLTKRANADETISYYRKINDYHFEQRNLLLETRDTINTEYLDRVFLEYDCPLMGYRALAFPVYFQENVLAVLYIGEICLSNRLEFIDKIQTGNYEKYNGAIKAANIEHRKWIDEGKYVYSDKKYNTLIHSSLREIKIFEERLDDLVTRQRKAYIAKKSSSYIGGTYGGLIKLQSESMIGSEGFKKLWKIVEEQLHYIRKDFKQTYLLLFGIDKFLQEFPNKLNVVASTDADFKRGQNEGYDIYYDLNKVEGIDLDRHLNSIDNPQILNGVVGIDNISPETHFVRIFPLPLSPSSRLISLTKYSEEWNPLKNPYFKGSGEDVARQILPLYNIITAIHAAILANTASENMKNALKVFRHEIGQQTSGLDWIRLKYFDEELSNNELTSAKLEDLNRDIKGYLEQVHYLSKKAKSILDDPIPVKEQFKIYRELIFKWIDTYRVECKRKKLQIKLPTISSEDESRPEINADKKLLEILIYNLMSNAIKYCYLGTKIHLDCKKDDLDSETPWKLTLTNYGIEIENSDKIYDFEYRSPNVTEEEGVGIGLYKARQIARAHGGNIIHEREHLSNFNIPLMQAYLDTDFEEKDHEIAEYIKYQLEILKRRFNYLDIVALTGSNELRYKPTIDELKYTIRKQTWKVTFIVTLPA